MLLSVAVAFRTSDTIRDEGHSGSAGAGGKARPRGEYPSASEQPAGSEAGPKAALLVAPRMYGATTTTGGYSL